MSAVTIANATPVAWSSVVVGDRVLAADRMWWTCTAVRRGRITIERAGRDPVTRVPPAGMVPCERGPWGREMVAAASVLVAAGFSVEVLPDWH